MLDIKLLRNNFDEVANALGYGQRTLDHATYAKLTNAFKKMVFHCLLWIFKKSFK